MVVRVRDLHCLATAATPVALHRAHNYPVLLSDACETMAPELMVQDSGATMVENHAEHKTGDWQMVAEASNGR